MRLRRGRARDVLDEAGEKDFFRGQKGQSRLKNVGKDESSGEGERKLRKMKIRKMKIGKMEIGKRKMRKMEN